jgi:hypothetical protein
VKIANPLVKKSAEEMMTDAAGIVPAMAFRSLTEADRQQLPPEERWELVGEYRRVFTHVTFFENEYARVCKEAMISLRDLRDLILETTAPTKARLPWLKLARFGEAKTVCRQSISDSWLGNLRECLAHQV